MLTSENNKNTTARTAQLQMRSDDGGALARSGDQHRRMARIGVCEKSYPRCTQGCGASERNTGVASRPDAG